MFKFNKPILPILAAPAAGLSAAILFGGLFRSVHMSPMVYESIAAFSFVVYTILGAIIFRDYTELRDYFVIPKRQPNAEKLFIIPHTHASEAHEQRGQ